MDHPLLVVVDDPVTRALVMATLTQVGYQPRASESIALALTFLAEAPAAGLILELTLLGPAAGTALEELRGHPLLVQLPLLVLGCVPSDGELRHIFEAGADDFVAIPFRPVELVSRLSTQLRWRRSVKQLERRERSAQKVAALTQRLASSEDIHAVLYEVSRSVAVMTETDRASIVLFCADSTEAHVVASSDDPGPTPRRLLIDDYPELRRLAEVRRVLLIDDVATEPLFIQRRTATPIPFAAMALVPILDERGVAGAVFLRNRARRATPHDELLLVQTLANAVGISLANAGTLAQLRRLSHANTEARERAEQKLSHLEHFADLLESAADGMMVIGQTGAVLFTNPRVREITGNLERSLSDTTVFALFAPESHSAIHGLLSQAAQGIFPKNIDLVARGGELHSQILNVNTSRVPYDPDAVLLTLRDVTMERRTAVELRQTKEFLERVIDASPDAIVSNDLVGNILVFNRAAARMIGFDSKHVVRHMSAQKLYPPGVARRILRDLADPDRGGFGRLDGYRTTVLSRTGDEIPVSLSAAFILMDNHPIGVVGLFTDLREQLRVEQELQRAEHELRNRERCTALAELAGAAAHELSQPLTSVIGYAELLRRGQPSNPAVLHATSIIVGEAERMAAIVRRIGTITRYETKPYVGESTILDLDRASPESGSWDQGS